MNTKSKMLLVTVAVGLGVFFPSAQLQIGRASAEGKQCIQMRLPDSSFAFAATKRMEAGNPRYAEAGDIATGIVVDSPGGEIHLNISPCEAEANIVIFRKPYERSTRGQKSCNGQTVKIEQLEQL
jgi:hypothetical protein